MAKKLFLQWIVELVVHELVNELRVFSTIAQISHQTWTCQ